jgi:hypothetical protein
MDNAQMWALVVGFAIPPILAVVQQPGWSQLLRTLVLAVTALVAGLGTAYFAGSFAGKDIVTSILIVLVTAIATYQGFWKSSGMAPAIEKATSPKGP